MIFPDEKEIASCPICDKRMYFEVTPLVRAKYYCCKTEIFNIGHSNFPHYEFYRYKDGSVYFQYIIDPIMIMSQENESTIYLLKEINNWSHSSHELATKKKTMFLVHETLEEIKNQIRLYEMFV